MQRALHEKDSSANLHPVQSPVTLVHVQNNVVHLCSKPDNVGMALLHISTEGLDLSSAGLLQGELEVDVLGHHDLLVKQGRLTLLGQAASGVLKTPDDASRPLHTRTPVLSSDIGQGAQAGCQPQGHMPSRESPALVA